MYANCLNSDYKDDGTNILLDANENAYGPGLALGKDGKLAEGGLNGTSSSGPPIDVDLLGLNRYPDPYVHLLSACIAEYLLY
jgi:histidinol-phosphate aminotransferase